ncbi:hypothetical protein ACT4ML_04120 [Natrinema sp. LN54]|uniref:hypothetical protein n=1 Tax=Natrinema sp. LN54 TaxID=3458705 RepID=UPI0040356CDC
MSQHEAQTRTRLASAHLDTEDLRRLEEILHNAGQIRSEEIEVEWGDYNRKYDSLDQFLSEPRKPNFIYKYEWTIFYEDQYLSIDSLSSRWFHTRTSAYISGNENWVRQMEQDLSGFYSRGGSRIRTFLGSFKVIAILSAILAILQLSATAVVDSPYSTALSAFQIIAVATLWFGVQPAYPYSALEFSEKSAFTTSKKILALAYSAVLFFGSLATIYLALNQL